MPTYRYECKLCEKQFDEFLKISESENIPCISCTGETFKVLFAVNLNFPGDSWVSKNLRINKQMRKKNEKLDAKQEEMKFYSKKVPKLTPNVKGLQTESWADAQKLAKDKGLNTSSYSQKVYKEAMNKKKK